MSPGKMILELLILILLLWLFTRGVNTSWIHGNTSNSPNPTNLLVSSSSELVLSEIKKNLELVCQQAHISPSFELFPSTTTSYVVDKSQIYLVLTQPDGSTYDRNTLMHSAIHELSHIVCSEEGHTQEFDRMEQHLLGVAESLHLYDSTKPLDKTYPCHES